MAYELSSSVKYVNPILGFYTEGPWTGADITAALNAAYAGIDPGIRVQGMGCTIQVDGEEARKYWFRDGVADGDLIEFTSGSGFDPENILTNLLFGSTSSPRKLERFYDTGTGFQYTGGVSFEDSYTVLEHKRVAAGITRLAQLILTAQSSLALVYDSPTGYNRLELTDSLTQILKVARYFSAPTLSNDLDIPHKKYIDDLSNSKQDRLAGIVSGCVIAVETFAGTPVATNKQIRVTNGTWYIPTAEHSKLADTVSSEITLCPTGGDFKYYDIVADDSGEVTIHEGTPSTAPAHYVIDPLTQVLLGFITVGDAVIEEPVLDLSGYVTRNGNETISRNEIFTTTSDIAFGINGIISNILYISTSQTQLRITNGSKFAGLFLNTDGSDANTRATLSVDTKSFEIHKLTGGTMYGDIIKYNSDRTTEINANGLALINRAYADDKYAGTVITTATTAKDSTTYHTEGIFTITDPTGVEGKGYDVLVLTGEVTVGGTPYATAGTYIRRRYVSGAWVTYLGGGSGTTNLSGIPTSTATANTLAFFDADKELISATDVLLGTLGIAITKEFTLDFDATEDTFEKTHNYYNDYITYSIRKADGSYYKETEYDVSSTTTTFTVVFVTPPSAGIGKLTLQSIQKEAVVPPEDEGFPYTLPLTF